MCIDTKITGKLMFNSSKLIFDVKQTHHESTHRRSRGSNARRMREGVATLYFQVQLVDKWEKRLVVDQELLDFRAESGVLLALKKETESESVGFFKGDECLGATFRQGKANRRVLWELFSFFAPIFHQGDVRRACPAHATSEVVRHCVFEGFVQPFVFHFNSLFRLRN